MDSATRKLLMGVHGIPEHELHMYDLSHLKPDDMGGSYLPDGEDDLDEDELDEDADDLDEVGSDDEVEPGTKAAKRKNIAAQLEAFHNRLGEAAAAESDALEEQAREIALSEFHKPLSELPHELQGRLYSRAALAIGYHQHAGDAAAAESDTVELSDTLEAEAADLALVETGKELSELSHEQRMELYERAAREMGYR